jgi:hypothetical protein
MPEGMEQEATATEATEDQGQTEDELAKWKSMARKHEKEAKQVKDRLAELENAGKSETEKLSTRLSDIEKKYSEADKRAMRLEVALEKGLPKKLALRLQGDSQEEMEADADDLLATLGEKKQKPANFDGGARQDPPAGDDINAMIRARAGRGSS